MLPTDKMVAGTRDFQQDNTRHPSFFSHKNTYLYVRKGVGGSGLLAVASSWVYIRGGREMGCAYHAEACDHQQTAALESSHKAFPSHDLSIEDRDMLLGACYNEYI